MARIAVIGAGMGAMAAAARLAVAGHRVVVYERADTFGGALGSVERDGFVFDTGPGSLLLPAVYRDLFVKTGRQPLEECVELSQDEPAIRHLFADGTVLDLPNASRAGATAALDHALGTGAGARWAAFMDRARETWDRARRPLLEEPLWPNWQVLADRDPYPAVARLRRLRTALPLAALEAPSEPAQRPLGAPHEPARRLWGSLPALGTVPRRTRTTETTETTEITDTTRTTKATRTIRTTRTSLKSLWARPAATLTEIAELELGGEPRLRALLEHHALAAGLDPRGTPSSAAVLPYLEHTFGIWSVRGGLRALARAVYERCLARRVEFRFRSEVRRIVVAGGRAAGVELADGTTDEAAFVVAGVAPDVLDRLLPEPPARTAAEVPARSGLPSRLTLLLALRGARPEDAAPRSVVHTSDRLGELDQLFAAHPGLPTTPTVTVLRPADPALVPDHGHEAVTVAATVPAGAEITDADVERVLARAERVVRGLRDRLLWCEVRTPADVAEATGAIGGAIPPPALAAAGGRLLHPSNTTRLPGLFTVGGWSHPGGGLPHAGMSGALVAGLIVAGPEFRGSQ